MFQIMFYYGLNDQDNDEYLINKSIAEIEENAIGKLFIFVQGGGTKLRGEGVSNIKFTPDKPLIRVK